MSGSYQRVFAREYNASSMTYAGSGTRLPHAVLTPGGATCTTLFCAGALVERQGHSGNFMYARLADPTAAFELQIDKGDNFTAGALESMEIPCFATVIGEARITGSGSVRRCFVRVRELRLVDRYVRDAWVLRTADLTIRRIDAIASAIRGETSNPLTDFLIAHYHPDMSGLRDLALMVKEALKGVNPVPAAIPSSGEPAAMVLEIIRKHGGKAGITFEEVARHAVKVGLAENEVKRAVESLLQEDECYQPARGVLKLL